jgi:hypothetical protein
VDANNCYVVNLARGRAASVPNLLLAVKRRRMGTEKTLLHTAIADLQYSRFASQRLDIEMDGASFAAWLNRPVVFRLFDSPVLEQMERKLIANWKDAEYRDGFTGVWGSVVRAGRRPAEFRVYSVGLSA